MLYTATLPIDTTLRLMTQHDIGSVVDAYRRNREHLAPWDPKRDDSFFTMEALRSWLARTEPADESRGAYSGLNSHGDATTTTPESSSTR